MSMIQFRRTNWMLVLVFVASGAMLLWPFIGRPLSAMREVGALQATQLINRQDALMLDLREPKEYEGGRVPNALHIPLSQLADRIQELGKFTARPLVAYCDRGMVGRGGNRCIDQAGIQAGVSVAGRCAGVGGCGSAAGKRRLMARSMMYSTAVCPYCVRPNVC